MSEYDHHDDERRAQPEPSPEAKVHLAKWSPWLWVVPALAIFFVGSWLVAASPGWPAHAVDTVTRWFHGDRPPSAFSALYALIIGFGASVGFHWFSDVVAGALLGTLVGLKTQHNSSRVAEP